MRKTTTSAEVKNRWNREHYDRLQVVVPAGAADEIRAAAAKHGQSVSAYIRTLIIRDNALEDVRELTGGGVAEAWERRRRDVIAALGIE